ncbi:hypothetical protein FA95DRAFT_1614324 [Auriscalpium vulgare]|uniref:Uncharacterized protein n=1 Tax=Auriscalpium vulgare TaxID=40419 RepID=A0ACB8QZS3_9AGAM|nr:hypothetical protein FA95DRAFT_1614324 [Auriscalpium vulgare]
MSLILELVVVAKRLLTRINYKEVGKDADFQACYHAAQNDLIFAIIRGPPDIPLPRNALLPSQNVLAPRYTVPVISIAALPPETSKAELRPVFLPFGPTKSIRSAADVLRADAERPIRVHSRKVIILGLRAELRVEEADRDTFEKFGRFERVVTEHVVCSSSDIVTAALAAQEHVPFRCARQSVLNVKKFEGDGSQHAAGAS